MKLLPKAALALFALLVNGVPAPAAPAEKAPQAEAFLLEGKLAAGEKALEETLKADPKDDQARFGLGVTQFLRAVEKRIQSFYRYGYRTDLGGGLVQITNLPIPPNPNPEPLDYQGIRALFKDWIDDLRKAEATLAGVQDPDVKLPLHFGLIRLDVNGDGQIDNNDTLWRVYANFNRDARLNADDAKDFAIAFDRGDVDWLRGYCHFLMAVAELALAHDFESLFTQTGFLFFRGAKPPASFLIPAGGLNRQSMGLVLDMVAMIHLIRLPVAEPGRLKEVLKHLEAMAALSRSSWKFILAETDDDREWVPNPKQATVWPDVRVTPEMVAGWNTFLDEFEAILAGRKLLPFWRGANPRLGINLRRVLTEPRELDLVLWVQGTAAAPFLEEGDVTSPETWTRLNRLFHGEFIGFVIWFN